MIHKTLQMISNEMGKEEKEKKEILVILLSITQDKSVNRRWIFLNL